MLCNIPKKIIKNLKFKIAQIEKHLIDNDNKSLESKKICYYCEKNFTTKHNLMRHLYDRCYEKKISTIKDLLCAKIITLDNKFYNYEDNDLLNQIEINEYNDCIAHCFNDDNKKNIYQDVELLLYNNRKSVDNYNNLLEL
jgi:hypothetical protein